MTTVIVCGALKDSHVTQSVKQALRAYGGVQSFDGSRIDSAERFSFLLYECENVPVIQMEKGILVFKNSFEPKGEYSIPGGIISVLDSQNMHAAAALSGTGRPAISCGTSARETLSTASIGYNAAVVSLQRDIKTINDDVLEPQDFKVEQSGEAGAYPLLAACAVLLLSGVPFAEGYRF